MQIKLCPIGLPDFGELDTKTEVPPATYANRWETNKRVSLRG
jgi:hypothetical protein